MRNYICINRFAVLGIFLAALFAWWAYGSVTVTPMEGPVAGQAGKQMEAAMAPFQEGGIQSLFMHCHPCPPCPVWQLVKTPRKMGPQGTDARRPHGQTKDHPPPSVFAPQRNSSQDELILMNVSPVQESKDKGDASIPVQDELSYSDVAPFQESKDKSEPVRVQDGMYLSDVDPIQENKPKGTPVIVHDELNISDLALVHESKDKGTLPVQLPKTPHKMGPQETDKEHPPNQKKDDPPPIVPASPDNSSQTQSRHKDIALKAVKFCGNVLTTSPVPLPFVIYWTTGHLDSTIRFYSKISLGSTALSSYAWLMYSILQVSYKDIEQVTGIDAIVVNAISWAVLAFMFMFLVMREGLKKEESVVFLD